GAHRPGDGGLLARCSGPTLDVGCGPGRLVAALAAAGLPTLGVDISAEAVRQARRRGAPAQRTCVFTPIAGEGAWQHLLLADGNIGIGRCPHPRNGYVAVTASGCLHLGAALRTAHQPTGPLARGGVRDLLRHRLPEPRDPASTGLVLVAVAAGMALPGHPGTARRYGPG